ncbi:unnamed protein product [Danaus chrysippus]|uniref:(African queen) hypothetical protein n=1 Tax=Danaus chrysippus TaxID=151541 RepID=A0A8J2QG88_9NEOP|nr:unnamed protein product [Danaus chrysippus]
MSHGRLSQSAILEQLLKEDEEESESELSDQGSETSDHIVAEEPLPAEESNVSDSEEGINSMVILRANNVTLRKRRMYLRALGTELIKEYIQKRSTIAGLPRKLKRNIREYLNIEEGTAGTEAASSDFVN